MTKTTRNSRLSKLLEIPLPLLPPALPEAFPPILWKETVRWFKRKRAQRHARSEEFSSFDVPIRKAIDHYVSTEPHSYTSNAELRSWVILKFVSCKCHAALAIVAG